MSVRKSLTTVTLMLHAPTFLEASPVSVIKDTVEMESTVLVCHCVDTNLYNESAIYPMFNFTNRY